MAKEYPSDWDRRRKSVYKRDNYTCQNCGRSGGPNGNATLHAHHIVPKSKGGTHSTSNLVAVCEQCHNAIHGNSRAPSSSASVPNQSSGSGYFDELSTLLGNTKKFATPAAKYIPLVEKMVDGELDDSSTMATLERRIQKQAVKQKAQLANFDANSAPVQAHDGLIDTINLLFDARIKLIDETQKLIEDVQNNRALFVSTAELACPECGDTVARHDDFCASCGEDLSAVGICPDCQSSISPDDDFCTNCGTDLSENKSQTGSEEVAERIRDKVTEVEDLADYVTTYNIVIRAHAGVVANTEKTKYVELEYCPNCGFKHSVFEINGAECVICGAQWRKKGLLTKKWEMTEGAERGETYSNREWEQLGKEQHQSEAYDEYISGEKGGTTEISQRTAKYSN